MPQRNESRDRIGNKINQKSHEIYNLPMKNVDIRFSSDLYQYLMDLPQFGRIRYEKETHFWYVELESKWQQNSELICELADSHLMRLNNFGINTGRYPNSIDDASKIGYQLSSLLNQYYQPKYRVKKATNQSKNQNNNNSKGIDNEKNGNENNEIKQQIIDESTVNNENVDNGDIVVTTVATSAPATVSEVTVAPMADDETTMAALNTNENNINENTNENNENESESESKNDILITAGSPSSNESEKERESKSDSDDRIANDSVKSNGNYNNYTTFEETMKEFERHLANESKNGRMKLESKMDNELKLKKTNAIKWVKPPNNRGIHIPLGFFDPNSQSFKDHYSKVLIEDKIIGFEVNYRLKSKNKNKRRNGNGKYETSMNLCLMPVCEQLYEQYELGSKLDKEENSCHYPFYCVILRLFKFSQHNKILNRMIGTYNNNRNRNGNRKGDFDPQRGLANVFLSGLAIKINHFDYDKAFYLTKKPKVLPFAAKSIEMKNTGNNKVGNAIMDFYFDYDIIIKQYYQSMYEILFNPNVNKICMNLIEGYNRNTVKIDNIPQSKRVRSTKEELRQCLEKFGTIKNVHILGGPRSQSQDINTHRGTYIAFVTFNDSESLNNLLNYDKAIKLDDRILCLQKFLNCEQNNGKVIFNEIKLKLPTILNHAILILCQKMLDLQNKTKGGKVSHNGNGLLNGCGKIQNIFLNYIPIKNFLKYCFKPVNFTQNEFNKCNIETLIWDMPLFRDIFETRKVQRQDSNQFFKFENVSYVKLKYQWNYQQIEHILNQIVKNYHESS